MKKQVLVVIAVALISLALFWAPFLFRVDRFWAIEFEGARMDTIVRNFDGINFIVVEKSWYDPDYIRTINERFHTGNEPIYFTAHYPLYAGLIWIFDLGMSAPNALLSSVLVSNLLLSIGLYMFFHEITNDKNQAMYLSILGLFFPARMMAVRGVGSTEPIFIFLILMSLVYAIRQRAWVSSVFGGLAVLTRAPGILLFTGYFVSVWAENRKRLLAVVRPIAPYMLMPTLLILLWVFYGVRFGSFLAYFQSGDNIHLFFPPLQIFSNAQSWSSGIWLEDAIYTYLFYGLGVYLFSRQAIKDRRLSPVVAFGLMYALVIPFIAHRDIARYSLPIAPIALSGMSIHLRGKAKWLLLFIAIPATLWGWNFVLENVQPVNDWSALV